MKVLHSHGLALGPLLAATLRDHKADIKRAQANELDPIELLELTCTLALASGQRVAPGLTLAEVEAVVDLDNAAAIFAACWGITLPEPAPGE